MNLPKFRYALLAGFILGIIVPLAIMLCFHLRIFRLEPDWLLFVWPTSIMLLATDSLGYSLEAFGILAVSIGYNVILYVVTFVAVWCVGWVIQAWRRSLRDGTTI